MVELKNNNEPFSPFLKFTNRYIIPFCFNYSYCSRILVLELK